MHIDGPTSRIVTPDPPRQVPDSDYMAALGVPRYGGGAYQSIGIPAAKQDMSAIMSE